MPDIRFAAGVGRRSANWLLCLSAATLLLASVAVLAVTEQPLDWRATVARVEALFGERAGRRVTAWRTLLNDGHGLDEQDQLERVNRFFNQLIFVDDTDLWGQLDYWATPLEFLAVNGGDCEDFSIAKYMSLLSLGVEPDKMRLVYVKSLTLNQFHMVLAYYPRPSAVPFILDNIDGEIRSADQRTDLVPIYSFNGQHLWLNKEKGRGVLTGKASRLKRWNDLRLRYRVQSLRQPSIGLE